MPGDFCRCLLEIVGAVAVKENKRRGNPRAETACQIDAVECCKIGIEVESSEGRAYLSGTEGKQLLVGDVGDAVCRLGKVAIGFLVGKQWRV